MDRKGKISTGAVGLMSQGQRRGKSPLDVDGFEPCGATGRGVTPCKRSGSRQKRKEDEEKAFMDNTWLGGEGGAPTCPSGSCRENEIGEKRERGASLCAKRSRAKEEGTE